MSSSTSQHSRYGGSTAARTLGCTAWRFEVDRVGELPSTVYADEGTLCHNVMETIYTGDAAVPITQHLGTEYQGEDDKKTLHVMTQKLFEDKIVPAVAAVEEIFDAYDVGENDFMCEARVTLDVDAWGTSDLIARGTLVEDNETYKVGICVDYKFGSGVPVTAEENQQGLYYATAALVTEATRDFFVDIDLLVIIIIQPNDHGIPTYTEWTVDPVRMKEFAAKFLEAKAISEDREGVFVVGDYCRFCPAKGLCPPTSGEAHNLMRWDATDEGALLLASMPTFEQYQRGQAALKAIYERIAQQSELGVKVKDWKLVATRATRRYKDEGKLEKLLKKSRKVKANDIYEHKLKSPAQMEKAFKAMGKKGKDLYVDLVHPHVEKKSSGNTLAPDSDLRPAAVTMGALHALIERGGV